jgi:transformation/transcription domain-associated protein
LRGLFDATRVEEFSDDANQYILDLARYIFSLELGKPLPDDATSHKEVLPLCSALIDGIIENLSAAENDDLQKAADQTQKIVEDLLATVNPVAEIKPDPPLVLLHQMATRLGSLCYDQSWQRKIGAAVGLSILTSRVNLGVRWILDHEIELTRALLFSLKDMPGEAPANARQVSDTLLHILTVCNAPGARDDTPAEKTKLDYLVGLLLVELCSQVASVRETVKTALQIISDSTGTPLTEMLLPVRDRLLIPIFTKPLRALAFTMQIGHIDAVTYCITLKPPLIDFDDQLSRLLHEALGIADAEDTALIGSKTTAKTTAPLTQLRVVCVQLLSAAMASPEFMTPKQQATRMKTLSVYFKLLYAKAPEVVEASYQSLKAVMATQGKLPKDLLQNGLKPVLMNLADHKKLSVASLQGLARLLELLTNYFKVEIGQKLLDHFRNLAVPADIIRASTRQPSEDGELEIMAAIVNIFHLLPHPAAGGFLDDVVKQVVDVERYLKKIKGSIFTTPLTQYLRIYPAETTTYFFARLADERFVSTFRSVIGSEFGAEIRAHITLSSGTLFAPCFDKTGGALGYHAALIIKELIDVEPEWIIKSPDVLGQLVGRWVSDVRRVRLEQQGDLHFEQLREDALILDIFVAYLKQAENIDILFHIVDVYTYNNSADHTALSRFINQHVALSANVAFKRQILDRFIDIYENVDVSKAQKTAALRLLVNPILLVSFSRGPKESIIDFDYINKAHIKIWQPALTAVLDNSTFDEESLRTELLHMGSLLLKTCSHLLGNTRKDLIKFGWVGIRFEDITVRQAAYLLVASFLTQFESPAKMTIQIYVALLRAHQNEGKLLVREALDRLTPVLPKRVISAAGETGAPGWAKWTKRILTEESSAIGQLVNIYQLLVRHSDLFYPTRELFINHIVVSLGKLTSSTTVTPDTRILTLDLIELILKWEKKRIELAKLEDSKMEVDGKSIVERSPKRPRAPSAAPSASSTVHSTNYVVPLPLRDQVINNLLRFIATSPEALPRNVLVSRALALLKELIGPSAWSELNIKLLFFQKTFAQAEVTDTNIVTLGNSAEVLNVVVMYKSDQWVLANYGILHKIVEKGYSSTEVRLHTAQRPLLERLFDVLPQAIASGAGETDPDVKAFVDWATTLIEEGLRNFVNVSSSIMVLQAWSKTSPERIDGFIPVLIRVFSTWAKEHNTSTTPVSTNDPQLRLLVSSLELLRARVSFLGDQRRWFLSAIIQLVEKSSNIELCRFLLAMTRKWVTDKEESYPTQKEKAALLLTMMKFESRNNEVLLKDFLTLILDIYTDPTHARSELTVKLEPAFLLGCKNRDPVIRSKFLAAFDKSLATGLFSRLHYVLGVQSWETLGDTYWIYQALDLVLGAVDTQDKLFQSTSTPVTEPSNAMVEDSTAITTPTTVSTFVAQLEAYTTGDLLGAARKLLYADPHVAHALWVSTFTATWACLSRREQLDLTRFVIGLLTKEYHLRSVDRRPSVIHTLLAAVLACSPSPSLPPHLVRYLSKTFNAWHIGIELLQEALENPREEESVRESTLDALAETYSELSEDDLLYGLWRRRAGYNETNAAIRYDSRAHSVRLFDTHFCFHFHSWEQIGQWAQAQVLYESAQITARSGVLPFSESEMALWEDHWIITAQKLQQVRQIHPPRFLIMSCSNPPFIAS